MKQKRIHPIWLFVIAVALVTLLNPPAFGQIAQVALKEPKKVNVRTDDFTTIRDALLYNLHLCETGTNEAACAAFKSLSDSIILIYDGKPGPIGCMSSCLTSYWHCIDNCGDGEVSYCRIHCGSILAGCLEYCYPQMLKDAKTPR